MPLFEHYQNNRRLWRAFYQHSRTFSLAARLLPRRVQLPIATVYLFCRRVDTLADKRVLDVGPDQALAELEQLHDHLERTLAGHPPDALLWRRLHKVNATFPLSRQALEELIAGATWDLQNRPIDTMSDLLYYSNLVGGSVGALMLPFLTSSDKTSQLDVPARRLGIAMQITNIVRDVGEDLHQLDRLYVPRTWLQQQNLTRGNLTTIAQESAPIPSAYASLMELAMNLAETHYASTRDAVAALGGRARLAIRGAARMYREILNEVRANQYDNLTQRAYVALPRKLRLLVHDNYDRRKASLRSDRAPTPEPVSPFPA